MAYDLGRYVHFDLYNSLAMNNGFPTSCPERKLCSSRQGMHWSKNGQNPSTTRRDIRVPSTYPTPSSIGHDHHLTTSSRLQLHASRSVQIWDSHAVSSHTREITGLEKLVSPLPTCLSSLHHNQFFQSSLVVEKSIW